MNRAGRPYRIAIVGAGPAAIYAAGHLLEQREFDIQIDMFERLPTPWGLVRAGVAPDHPEKKLVVDRQFAFILNRPEIRFFGNVEIGDHIRHSELADWYDGLFYATGADSDTRLGIPGEDELQGCWAAREFVAWYNGHPGYSHLDFDLSGKRAVIVGNGNVALDVARILTLPIEMLEKTDIADHALEALRSSNIEEVVLLGRRGHLQGAFNNPELEELEHIPGVDIVVDTDDLSVANEVVMDGADWATRRKAKTLFRFARKPLTPGNKRIRFRFLSSPVELLGDGRVSQVLVVSNHLVHDENGRLQARATEEEYLLDTGLVFRAIGYRGTPFPGLPFDDRQGVIDNDKGRVIEHGKPAAGVYVTGWIKRGAKGVIGTNKKCAMETVRCFFEDIRENRITKSHFSGEDIAALLLDRQPNLVDKSAWKKIDHHERVAGRLQRRPRVKLTNFDDMLAVVNTL